MKSMLATVVCVVVTVAQGLQTAHADAVTVRILRQHSDATCVSGQVSINNKIVAYSLERRFEGNIPLISSIEPGSYSAFVRHVSDRRWRIELKGVRDRSAIQLHIGNFTADSRGCILIGRTISGNKCELQDSAAGFAAFKLEFARAAGGQPDQDVPIRVEISDR